MYTFTFAVKRGSFCLQEEAVIMVGNFADVTTAEQKSKINHVTRWYKPWFYKHVETFLQKVRHIS